MAPGRKGRRERGQGGAHRKRGGLGLKRLGGDDFVLIHPKCVREMELDYEEGIELRKAGDPEAARDALRFALQGCGDNIWVHVALGRIALDEFRDPSLARGHFGYAFELADKVTIPPRLQTAGSPASIPPTARSTRRWTASIKCHDALGAADLAGQLRQRATRAGRGRSGPESPWPDRCKDHRPLLKDRQDFRRPAGPLSDFSEIFGLRAIFRSG